MFHNTLRLSAVKGRCSHRVKPSKLSLATHFGTLTAGSNLRHGHLGIASGLAGSLQLIR